MTLTNEVTPYGELCTMVDSVKRIEPAYGEPLQGTIAGLNEGQGSNYH